VGGAGAGGGFEEGFGAVAVREGGQAAEPGAGGEGLGDLGGWVLVLEWFGGSR